MESLKKEDLIKGQYYRINEGNTFTIALFNGFEGVFNTSTRFDYTQYISTMNGRYEYINNSTPSFGANRPILHATEQEIAWLKACIENNRFIALGNVKFEESYSVFN